MTQHSVQRNVRQVLKAAALVGGVSLLAACGGDNDSDNDSDRETLMTYSYEVTVTNLANSQPFSPMGVLIHGDDFQPWQVGESASMALEDLAEGGDNTAFIEQSSESIEASGSGNGLIMPGAQDSISVSVMVAEGSPLNLSLATMLVNTNDAFAGINGMMLSDLMMGESHDVYLPVYDAGTEANSEAVGTIPGPADGGEGTNAARDDVDYVAMHPGVVGKDDGYATSVLDSTHTFDGPIAKLTVRRTQ